MKIRKTIAFSSNKKRAWWIWNVSTKNEKERERERERERLCVLDLAKLPFIWDAIETRKLFKVLEI